MGVGVWGVVIFRRKGGRSVRVCAHIRAIQSIEVRI